MRRVTWPPKIVPARAVKFLASKTASWRFRTKYLRGEQTGNLNGTRVVLLLLHVVVQAESTKSRLRLFDPLMGYTALRLRLDADVQFHITG